ncbi:farnesyl pyrophosphate synthase-like [Lutzomyia longipalpis]|uniref:farnesyl pyrophosphate synthase-like n=1 Tax=Lutzomyia longipalpis TaxID=7200 RepID=UPI002483EA6B|nr:farnesyl pyrophosphate synthase-like [Lutzomyia longipalpis]
MFSVLRISFAQNLVKSNVLGAHLLHPTCTKSKGIGSISTRTLSSVQETSDKSQDNGRDFKSYFPEIVRQLKGKAKIYDLDEGKHFERVLEYNAQSGKLNRGRTMVNTYKMIAPKTDLTEENLKLANYLGWCIELLQGYFLLLDDIMDGSITRRGKPCWYKLEDIGLGGINDGMMLEATLYQVLMENFSHLKCYTKLMELFQEVVFISILGEHLDLRSAKQDVLSFTMDLYNMLNINKTAWYTYYLPVACAMYLAGYTDEMAFRRAQKLLLDIGYYFQVQDDYLDVYGDPAVTGKIGTDIQDGRCTWFVVTFLMHATDTQKALLKESYGKNDPECVERVKKLYEEISMLEIYKKFENDTRKTIMETVEGISGGLPKDVYYMMMGLLHNRKS